MNSLPRNSVEQVKERRKNKLAAASRSISLAKNKKARRRKERIAARAERRQNKPGGES